MRPDPSNVPQPVKVLTRRAEQAYGALRTRDLTAQLRQTAAAMTAVETYPLVPETEPWLAPAPPALQLPEAGTRA